MAATGYDVELLSSHVKFEFTVEKGTYCTREVDQKELAKEITHDLKHLADTVLAPEEMEVLKPVSPFTVVVNGELDNHHEARSYSDDEDSDNIVVSWHHEAYKFYKTPEYSLSVTRKIPGVSIRDDEIKFFASKRANEDEISWFCAVELHTSVINNTQLHIYISGPLAGTAEIDGYDKKVSKKELCEFLPWLDWKKLKSSVKYQREVTAKLRSMIFFNQLPE